MKIIFIILATFIIAILTSALLEFSFFGNNPVRYVLVVLLIIFELFVGYFYIKSEIKNINQNQNG